MKKPTISVIVSDIALATLDGSGNLNHSKVVNINDSSQMAALTTNFGRYRVKRAEVLLTPDDPNQTGVGAVSAITTDEGTQSWTGSQGFAMEDILNKGGKLTAFNKGTKLNIPIASKVWYELDAAGGTDEGSEPQSVIIRACSLSSGTASATVWWITIQYYIEIEYRDYN